ncbi:MAG: response regulator [Bacteroidia bacterium]|nr:response regulator [Bacteroidia bacterium]
MSAEKKTKVLIVEDESIVAKDIQNILLKNNFEITGIANNADTALNYISQNIPDVILMDIMIKGNMNGIDLSHKIKEEYDIPIIFLTAYSDISTLDKAKLVEPYAYINKPFKNSDIISAIEISLFRHKKDLERKKEKEILYSIVEKQGREASSNVIFVKSGGKMVRIKFDEIFIVEALKDYVTFHTTHGRYIVHATMKFIEEKLGQKDFLRVHRSFIVRTDKIQGVENQELILENFPKTIPIGGNYKDLVYQKLNLL